MKRLLCAGSGPIYQIARVFRDFEEGRVHSPEFTLLEWYRPGFGHHALMDEVEQLLSALLGSGPCERLDYGRAFEDALGIDPHVADLEALAERARGLGLVMGKEGPDRGGCLDFLLSHALTPRLGLNGPTFLYDFPEAQAGFAALRAGTPPIAERFELFIQGIEIANGCRELTDAAEQRRRLIQEETRRRALGLPYAPLDQAFLAALESGMPDCAGCALGLDRLLMVATGVSAIDEVLAFPLERA